MRIWDIDPNLLCNKHLVAEHFELHTIWNVITQNKKGYSNHPETKRWVGKLKALYNIHESIVIEMNKRGYNHKSNIDINIDDNSIQDILIDSIDKQIELLKNKGCNCYYNISNLIKVGNYV